MQKRKLIVCLCLISFGCGGGGTFSHGLYQDDEVSYRVGPLAPGWERITVGDRNDLAWRNPALEAIIQVNSSCDPEMDVPLSALTNHLLIGFTERRIQEQRLVTMDNREALRTLLVAKLDGVPREMLLTVLKKNGCVYDFSLVAPPDDHFTRALPDIESLLSGFRSESRS